MTWDERFAQYRALRDAGVLGEWRHPLELDLRKLMLRPSESDVAWLAQALSDADARDFAVLAIRQALRIPEALFRPAIGAAIASGHPGASRAVVEPLVQTFGYRAVNDALLTAMEQGGDEEKIGAVAALYWAQPQLDSSDRSRGFGLEAASPDVRRTWMSLADVWARKNRLYLETFVLNANPRLRAALIPHLDLEPRRHPSELRALVLEAARLALEHEDPYVRRRVEGVFGPQAPKEPNTPYRREIAG
jgi:hypothetical protein